MKVFLDTYLTDRLVWRARFSALIGSNNAYRTGLCSPKDDTCLNVRFTVHILWFITTHSCLFVATTFHSAPCLIQTLITTPPHRVIARAQRNTRGLSPCPEIVRELDTSEEEVLEELFWTSNTSTDSLLVRELWKTKRRLSSPEGDSRPAKKQRLYRSGELPAAGLALEARVHGPVDSSSRPPSRRESVDSLASESLASINLPCKEHATSTLLDLSLYLRRSHNKLRSVMKSRSSSPLRLRLLSSRLKHYAHSSVVIDASEDTSLYVLGICFHIFVLICLISRLRTSREHGDLNCLYNKNISQSSSSPHLDAKTILAELSSVDTNGMCIFEEGKVHMGREFRIPRLQ